MTIDVLFFGVFILFAMYFIFSFFSKRGKLLSIKIIFGSAEVKEIATLPSTQFSTKLGITTTQDIKIYECSDGDQKFYVLETTNKNFGAIGRHYTKLTPETLKMLKDFTDK